MGKLSTSQMRQNGLTAFEAELVNYILTNEISEGATFAASQRVYKLN